MKKVLILGVLIVTALYLSACGRKDTVIDQMQDEISLEAIGNLDENQSPAVVTEQVPAGESVSVDSALPPLPPGGPYKPTDSEIQTALKNAGFYTGSIDGKAGPMTMKAIEDFQKANNLQVDGKVGPKTWGALGVYLESSVNQQQGANQ